MLSIQSEFLTPKKEVPEGKKVKMYKVQWNHHTEVEATWEIETYLQRNFPDFLRTNPGTKSFCTYSSCNLGTRFLLGGKAVTP